MKHVTLGKVLFSILTVVSFFLLWWIFLPPMSFNFFGTVFLCGMFIVLAIFSISTYFGGEENGWDVGILQGGWEIGTLLGLVSFAIITVICIIVWITSWGMFRWRDYYNQIGIVEEKNYVDEISPIDLSQVPYVDEDYAKILGEKTLGVNADLGSKVEIGEFAMQEVNGRLVLVAPLEHSGFFKYNANKAGTPGYVVVSASNAEDVKLVTELDGKPLSLRYLSSAFFGDDLLRHIRKEYKNEGLTEFTFELDDTGRPYYVVTTYKNTVAWTAPEATGVIVIDVETGDMEKYSLSDAPEWIDIIQPKAFVSNQIKNWGRYVKGAFNFSNENKLKATEGMDTIYNNGSCYYYTGITSYSSDSSTNGFILVNTRTKEAIKYNLVGGNENSAQASAEGQVQNMGYIAGFPLPVNLDGVPTYFMPLKDNSGYVKMFAFVNIEYIQQVATGDSVISAKNAYVAKISASGNNIAFTDDAYSYEEEGIIARIAFTMLDGGSTVYMFTIEGDEKNNIYQITPNLSNEIILTVPGDEVTFECVDDGNGNITVTSFENKEVYTKKSEEQIAVDERVEEVTPSQDKVTEVNPEENEKIWDNLTDEEKAKLLESLGSN